MAGPVTRAVLGAGAAGFAWVWELRRRGYAAGWLKQERLSIPVISVGNLTVGGTGKTTLTLWLARHLAARGRNPGVVCRNYRPGPGGWGDEALLYREALGSERVFAGGRKRDLARQAAHAGFEPALNDDGFSHWSLDRDLDLVVLDARDPWGGGRLLPAGRLREPRRALQRASMVVISRLRRDEDPRELIEQVRRYAPAAGIAAGRHRVRGIVRLDGTVAGPVPVRVVTATGNPSAVAESAREAGLEVRGLSAYRDHHWWTAEEARRERTEARAAGARLLITAKDRVRWPVDPEEVDMLEVEWEWVRGEAEVLRALETAGRGAAHPSEVSK